MASRLGLSMTALTSLSDISLTMRMNSPGSTAAICSALAVVKSMSDMRVPPDGNDVVTASRLPDGQPSRNQPATIPSGRPGSM